MNLRLDPDRLADIKQPLGALINRHGITETHFGYYSSDPLTGPRCGRCNNLLHVHLWQLVNPDMPEQGGVINCGGTDW